MAGSTVATVSRPRHTPASPVRQKNNGRLKGHGDQVVSVAFVEDGKKLISASNDRTLKLWSAQPKEETEQVPDHLVLSPAYDLSSAQPGHQGIELPAAHGI